MLKLRKCLHGIKKYSYAEKQTEADGVLFDCALGINPLGYSKNVREALLGNTFDINSYPGHPHSSVLRAIASLWAGQADLKEENIRLTGGSIMALDIVCKLFVEENSRVLGYKPQFMDFIACAESMGGIYDAIDMRASPDCAFDAQRLSDAIDDSCSIVYVDNPNNPTGQIISLENIALLAKKAASLSIPLLVDEAYGDYMRMDQSAIALLGTYDNIIVVRSFSKGYGLAGLRAGYIVCGSEMITLCGEVSYPFSITDQAAFLVETAIGDQAFLESCRNEIAQAKSLLLNGLTRLRYYKTDMHVPIMTLIDPEGGNLHGALRKRGVLTEAGADLGLDHSAARLRIPRRPQALLDILNSLSIPT